MTFDFSTRPKPFLGMLLYSRPHKEWYILKEPHNHKNIWGIYRVPGNTFWSDTLTNITKEKIHSSWSLPGEPNCPLIPEALQRNWKVGDLYYFCNYNQWPDPNALPEKQWDKTTGAFIYEDCKKVSDFAGRALYLPSSSSSSVITVAAIDSIYCQCPAPLLVQRYAGGWFDFCQVCKKERK